MSTFLTARWLDLAMLNYEVDPKILAPYVPAGTKVDQWNGKTFVSIVGFMFVDTKVMGVSVPFHTDFEELNLRFYVRREVGDEVRRGVVFVKEIVPKIAIAATARWLYNENYVALPMRHDINEERVRYEWELNGRWNHVEVQRVGDPYLPASGSEEEFITEHYWGYAKQKDGSTVEYKVEHPQWDVWRAGETSFDCDVEELYAPEFRDALSGKPSSAFVARGSETKVMKGVALEDPA